MGSKPPKLPPRGVLKSLPEENTKDGQSPPKEVSDGLQPPSGKGPAEDTGSSSKMPSNKPTSDFHVFAWLEHIQVFAGGSVPELDREALDKQMGEVDVWLSEETSKSDQKAYQDCAPWTRAEQFTYFTGITVDMKGCKNEAMSRFLYEERIDILNAADIIFTFFLPSEYSGPTAGRFWGAVRYLIEVRLYRHYHG